MYRYFFAQRAVFLRKILSLNSYSISLSLILSVHQVTQNSALKSSGFSSSGSTCKYIFLGMFFILFNFVLFKLRLLMKLFNFNSGYFLKHFYIKIWQCFQKLNVFLCRFIISIFPCLFVTKGF